jgi:2-dehydro-3-deoxyphosphooctonate aldolase (KDO 8-P synthase)
MIPQIKNLKHSGSGNFFLMAGPCVIEGEKMALEIAEKIVEITNLLQIPFIFKGSYRKANRSRLDSFSGIGDEKALKILQKVGKTFDIPTVTDIHTAAEAALAAQFVDVLQIPAFLCRQTDILIAAAQTGKVVNIKKVNSFRPMPCSLLLPKFAKAATTMLSLRNGEQLLATRIWWLITVESPK